jgi:UDP-N-acetylglucosamine--N-acetylmuramyl-(pentapeptide) pyrophosphoryl-undecaprenol N-acetylglucosamine transferase
MSRRIIISGGGTGGHIYPAISIANALKLIDPTIEILFVGAQGRMEMEKVPAAGYEIVGLPIAGIQRSLTLKNLSVPFKLMKSLSEAGRVIDEFKPDAVVGVGGYASGPVLYMANRKDIPTLIQEQNSYAGVTNKILSKKAKRICTAYDGMERFFPAQSIIKTGNPVRQDLVNLEEKRAEAYSFFGLDPNKKTVLVLGGSLGARTINRTIAARLDEIKEQDFQLLWQTGKFYIGESKKAVDESGATNVKIMDFIYKMDLAFAVANVVVSRAGAGTISELCLVSKPCILVPSPNVSEDHQTKNAMALVNEDAALLVTDAYCNERLMKEVVALVNNPEKCEELSKNIAKLGIANSAERIANEILKLIE